MAAEQAELTKQQILDREARWARPVALAALVTPLFLIAAIIVGSSEVSPTNVDAAGLEAFESAPGQQLIATVLQIAQVALFAPVLLYMFLAASARSDRMRPAFVGVTVAGPLFLAASLIPGWIALDSAASAFVNGGGDLALSSNERADELMNDQGANGVFGGLQLAGSLGLIVGMVYTSLYASRVGLLTRSSGIVGIVLGIGLLFVGLFGIQLFIIALGLLVAGFWPRGRPPAWAAGVAVPWPAAGNAPNAPPENEEEPGLPQGFGEPSDPDSTADESLLPSRMDGAPRKRKRRR